MKNFIMLLVMGLFLSITSFAQVGAVKDSIQQNATVVATTTAERIVDKYADKVSNTLSSIVDGLKEPAKEVFQSVVMLQIAKGIALLLLLIPTIIFWIVFVQNYKKVSKYIAEKRETDKYHNNYTWDDVQGGTMTIIYLVCALVFTLGTVFTTYWGLLYIFAPKWFAIMELVNLVK